LRKTCGCFWAAHLFFWAAEIRALAAALAMSTLPAFFAVWRYTLELVLTMTVTPGDGR
jgi:hypothetical protein